MSCICERSSANEWETSPRRDFPRCQTNVNGFQEQEFIPFLITQYKKDSHIISLINVKADGR